MRKRKERPQTDPSEVSPTSSTPLELPEEQEALFHEILLRLERAGIPYAVAGAFALRQHTGICRSTKDLDLFLCPQVATQVLTL